MRLLAPDFSVGQTYDMVRAPQGNITQQAPGFPPGMPGTHVGQPSGPNASCPILPASFTVEAATGNNTINLGDNIPGAFCPIQMIVTGSNLDEVFFTEFSQGRRNMVLEGRISAHLFGLDNPCCYVGCLPCLCAPGVSYNVSFDVTGSAQDVTATFYGTYADWCSPGGVPPVDAVQRIMPPGCQFEDALVGIDIEIPASGTFEYDLDLPGFFCPRRLLATGSNVDDITLTEWRTGRLSDILGEGLPLSHLGPTVECCPPLCFQCSCAPGVPIHIEATGSAGQTAHLDVVGSFRDAC